MDELIARLEKAEGPNFALEVEIYNLIYPERYDGLPKNYTASIDSALTLIPEGWFLNDVAECVAPIRFAGDRHESTGLFQAGVQHRNGGRMTRANGRSMALAICIAALRARATP